MVLALAAACGSTKRDGDGPVKRVVALTPSSTELVAAVGAADRLVGVDRYSVHPPRVKDLPKVGDFMHPNFEAIVALRPDLVVLSRVQGRLVSKLEKAGIRTLALDVHDIDDVRDGLRKVGEALDVDEQAEAAVRKLSSEVEAIRRRTAARTGTKPTVAIIIGRQVGTLRTMVAAGPGSFMDELIGYLGATNALASSPVRYPKISVEQIMRSKPDIILDAVRSHEAKRAKADWAALDKVPAVQHGRIYPITDQIFMAPGPRVGRALRMLARILYPDL